MWFRILALLTLAISATMSYAYGAEIAGDWTADLQAGPQKLRLLLHVEKTENGAHNVTLDSPDQGARGMPTRNVSLQDNKFSFEMSQVTARFEGTVADSGDRISGIWEQSGAQFPLVWERAGNGTVARQPGWTDNKELAAIVGTWRGELQAAGQRLPLVFRIREEDGGYVVTMQSPAQSPQQIPVADVAFDGKRVEFGIPAIAGVFRGVVQEGGKKISGEWAQGGQSTPLDLNLGPETALRFRPQEPKEPFPYQAEGLRFPGGVSGVTLAGTLTLPSGRKPFPAVILLSGSGPQDRNESIFGHKPFLVIADFLTRRGIAVLRFDDRGVGESTGSFVSATTRDFAADASAALTFLRGRPEIDDSRIAFLGHSEGALAALIATRNGAPARCLVFLAGPAIPGDQVILSQVEIASRLTGSPPKKGVEELDAVRERFRRARLAEADPAEWKRLETELVSQNGGNERAAFRQIEQLRSPWMREFLAYDPSGDLEALQVPVLALFAEKDVQVIPSKNVKPMQEALAKTRVGSTKVEVLPGLNHLFQTAESGSVSEYGTIEETISPTARARILSWLQSSCGLSTQN